MAVGGVDRQQVHPGVDQRFSPGFEVRAHADRRARPQPPLGVDRRVREVHLLLDVLDGDQPLQLAVLVDQRQFFDAVLLEDGLCLLESRSDRRGDQPLAGHELADRLAEIPRLEEADVAVGEDPDQLAAAALFGDRNARDVEFAHQVFRFLKRGGGIQGDRVGDHPGFRPLDLLDECGLGFDREVAVDDPQPAFARQGDRHPRFGHGIHRR